MKFFIYSYHPLEKIYRILAIYLKPLYKQLVGHINKLSKCSISLKKVIVKFPVWNSSKIFLKLVFVARLFFIIRVIITC